MSGEAVGTGLCVPERRHGFLAIHVSVSVSVGAERVSATSRARVGMLYVGVCVVMCVGVCACVGVCV